MSLELKNKKSSHVLSVFALVMITVGSVDSVRNLPATALFGSQLIFFFGISALFFLIPCALVSAELSAAYPRQGGIYVWVKEAFGEHWGFAAIWFQWIENVIWYPTILSFVAGTIGYLIEPQLAQSHYFLVSVILVSFWGATLVNLFGMKSSARFSSLCACFGLLVPMTLIIALGATWLLQGHHSEVSFHARDFFPHAQDSNLWVALTGIMLSFCGIEIATVHAGDVANPQKEFPRALLISVFIILFTLVLGSLSIAIVLPASQISLVAGIMQAFDVFFKSHNMAWILPLMAVMLVIGALGGVSNWIIAPTKGLLIAGRDGHLPPMLQTTNRFQAPTALLILQAVIVSILTMAFLFFPTINASYWLLTALAAQLYMLMYILMFAAAIALRFKNPHHAGSFRIPGGFKGVLLVGSMGIIACMVTFAVSFIPPDNIQVGNRMLYDGSILLGLLLMCAPPVITWKMQQQQAWIATQS